LGAAVEGRKESAMTEKKPWRGTKREDERLGKEGCSTKGKKFFPLGRTVASLGRWSSKE